MTEPAPQPTPKKSDLGVRTLSAIVMVAVAGTALWLGGWVWTVFVAAVALGVLWEWRGLVVGFEPSPVKRGLWNAGGLVYVGLASVMLAGLRNSGDKLSFGGVIPFVLVFAVIATDVGAYFAGRSIGGPKIAPKISPSKTWAGLFGGILGAFLVFELSLAAIGAAIMSSEMSEPTPITDIFLWRLADGFSSVSFFVCLVAGAVFAIIAQSGDFFESWMKRRAGVKDSGKLIPGHGGLFDRVDGLLAVCFVIGLYALVTIGGTLLSGGSLLPSPN